MARAVPAAWRPASRWPAASPSSVRPGVPGRHSVHLGLPVEMASAPLSGVVPAWRLEGRIFQNLPSAAPCVSASKLRGPRAARPWGLVRVLLPQGLRAPSPHQTKQAQAKENLGVRRLLSRMARRYPWRSERGTPQLSLQLEEALSRVDPALDSAGKPGKNGCGVASARPSSRLRDPAGSGCGRHGRGAYLSCSGTAQSRTRRGARTGCWPAPSSPCWTSGCGHTWRGAAVRGSRRVLLPRGPGVRSRRHLTRGPRHPPGPPPPCPRSARPAPRGFPSRRPPRPCTFREPGGEGHGLSSTARSGCRPQARSRVGFLCSATGEGPGAFVRARPFLPSGGFGWASGCGRAPGPKNLPGLPLRPRVETPHPPGKRPRLPAPGCTTPSALVALTHSKRRPQPQDLCARRSLLLE